MNDNVVYATDSIRSSVSSLKKKLSNLKISIELFDSELDKIETKFDKLLTQTEIYKSKLQREIGRQVRKLELENEKLKKELGSVKIDPTNPDDELDLRIASTLAIFECILRHMCEGADDVKLMSYSFLFPAVFERVVSAEDEAYFLDELPDSCMTVIQRGREYVSYIRQNCETHVTDPDAWELFVSSLSDWWKNDALPLIYGSRDDDWETDVPLSLAEMLIWKNEPSERPFHFSKIFDGFEIYRKLKDAVYDSSGVRNFDLKMFTFQSEFEEPKG